MKPSAFDYHAPATEAEAVDLLAAFGPDAKVLAGGQSLIPLLNMRLAAPGHIVDINRAAGLDTVRTDAAGVTVGALVRHTDLEADPDAAEAVPLLRQGLRLVAHPVIRNRGTTVGSIAHADPSAEMAAALAVLGGAVRARGAAGTRDIAAAELFTGQLETCLRPDELLTSAFFPRPAPGTGSAFVESSRRHGDYAVCGLAALVTLDADLRIIAARGCYLSMAPTPAVLDLTGPLAGRTRDSADFAAAGRLAAAELAPLAETDIHATAEYRVHLAGVLTARALSAAALAAVEGWTARDPAHTHSGRA